MQLTSALASDASRAYIASPSTFALVFATKARLTSALPSSIHNTRSQIPRTYCMDGQRLRRHQARTDGLLPWLAPNPEVGQ